MGEKKRIDWIDFGKGFTVLLVLIGHVFLGMFQSNKFLNSNSILLFMIEQFYIFHIPVFFTLSGALFRPLKSINQYPKYFVKKTLYLGIPYVFYSILHFCLQKIAGSSVRISTSFVDLLNIYKTPLGVSWYLYTLWFIYILYGLISLLVKNQNYLFVISTLGLAYTSVLPLENLQIDKLLLWSCFFMLGNRLINFDFSLLTKNKLNIIIIIWLILDFIFMYIWSLSGETHETSYEIPGIWMLGFVLSAVVGFILYSNAERLPSSIYNYFKKYGKDSLGIYILHAPICSMLRIVMLKVGITSVYIHVIVGIVLGWYLSILATNILKKMPYLNIVLLPQKYIKIK